jgi:hypothetical protein
MTRVAWVRPKHLLRLPPSVAAVDMREVVSWLPTPVAGMAPELLLQMR